MCTFYLICVDTFSCMWDLGLNIGSWGHDKIIVVFVYNLNWINTKWFWHKEPYTSLVSQLFLFLWDDLLYFNIYSIFLPPFLIQFPVLISPFPCFAPFFSKRKPHSSPFYFLWYLSCNSFPNHFFLCELIRQWEHAIERSLIPSTPFYQPFSHLSLTYGV